MQFVSESYLFKKEFYVCHCSGHKRQSLISRVLQGWCVRGGRERPCVNKNQLQRHNSPHTPKLPPVRSAQHLCSGSSCWGPGMLQRRPTRAELERHSWKETLRDKGAEAPLRDPAAARGQPTQRQGHPQRPVACRWLTAGQRTTGKKGKSAGRGLYTHDHNHPPAPPAACLEELGWTERSNPPWTEGKGRRGRGRLHVSEHRGEEGQVFPQEFDC